MRAGLVRTFVQVPEVERVTLLIDGDPLQDSKGREIGTMTAESFQMCIRDSAIAEA